MGFWGSINNGFMSEDSLNNKSEKVKNFEKHKIEIEKTKAYIKAKREAFYKNNNLKDG